MSLRLKLFLGLSSLVAAMVLVQWWWIRGLTRELSDEVGDVAVRIGHSLAAILAEMPEKCEGDDCPEPGVFMRRVLGPAGNQLPDGDTQFFDVVMAPDPPDGTHRHVFAEPDAATPPLPVPEGEDTEQMQVRVEHFKAKPGHKMIIRLERREGDAEAGEGDRFFGGWQTDTEEPLEAAFLTVGSADDFRRIPIPSQGLRQKIDGFRQRLLWGSAGLLALGLLLAAVIAHRVAAPLQRLALAARQVGDGALGTQVEVAASGEVQEAIHAFNRMSSELEILEQKNRELRSSRHLGEIGEIARGLAHTLRNPLNALGLSVEELAGRAGDGTAELAGAARRQIRRIDHSIRSFLVLASQGGGVTGDVRLDDLVHDVALEALQDSHGRGVKLDVEAATDVSSLFGVEPELRAVIQALVVNAVEASPENGRVELGLVAAEGGVRIDVADRGPGLPEEVRARLFTPHLTTKANGSGMGLFLAHRIATTRYGGRLELRDRSGGGTRAVLELGPRNQELHDE